MDSTSLKPKAFIIQNGKLVPRPNTPEKKKNYCYIAYDPVNNPVPEDYFRETITRLQKQNNILKNQLNKILQDQASKPILTIHEHQLDLVRGYQAQVLALKQELARKDKQLQQKNQELIQKDKQILQISSQNTRLHLRVINVVKQIQKLNAAMSRKDQQILIKKQQLEQYCRTLDKLTLNEKQQKNTIFSQNNQTTPRIQEKGEQQEDDGEFSTISYKSLHQRNERRYMTPVIQPFNTEQKNQQLNLTHEIQKSPKQNPQNIQKSSNKEIISNFKTSLWTSQQRQNDSNTINRSSKISSYIEYKK